MSQPMKGHMIGSRHFGHVHDNSDWDFIMEDTPDARRWLTACGFLCKRWYLKDAQAAFDTRRKALEDRFARNQVSATDYEAEKVKLQADLNRSSELANRSFWRHKTYQCEIFLVKSEEQRRILRAVIRYSKFFRVIVTKQHRRQVWYALERCIGELWRIYKDHKQWRIERLAHGWRLRDKPLT
jgi:hypothetical protein